MTNIQKLINLGGKEWVKGDMHRVYFDNPSALIGLETESYKTGNIKSATLKGEKISNSQAYKLIDKIYFDIKNNEFVGNKKIIELIDF